MNPSRRQLLVSLASNAAALAAAPLPNVYIVPAFKPMCEAKWPHTGVLEFIGERVLWGEAAFDAYLDGEIADYKAWRAKYGAAHDAWLARPAIVAAAEPAR